MKWQAMAMASQGMNKKWVLYMYINFIISSSFANKKFIVYYILLNFNNIFVVVVLFLS